MRKYSAFIALACMVSVLFVPLPTNETAGVYNTFSGLFWCESHIACVHEIGHKLDQNNGWASQTKEFNDALKIYILSESKKNNPSETLYQLFSGNEFSSAEVYANLFSWSDGKSENIPETFRKFYDWNYAKILLKDVR